MNRKILLLGRDEADIRDLMTETGRLGYQTSCQGSVDQALAAWNEQSPSLVLVDPTILPAGLDAFLRRIRGLGAGSHPFVVALLPPPREDEPSVAGVDDVLRRPWKRFDIEARLRAAERLLSLEEELSVRMNHLEQALQEIGNANDQIKKNLTAVAKIQTSLLPVTLPAVTQAEFSWVYRPQSYLAGDGLNVFRLDEDHVAFYVLDVAGSGTTAAFFSVALSRMLSPFPQQSSLLKFLIPHPPGYALRGPAKVLGELNGAFPLNLETKQFFTIFYGMLELSTLQLTYATAGQPLPILLRSGKECAVLAGSGYPIGFVDDASFEERMVPLQPADRLYIFTDGLSETANAKGEQFGKAGLLQAIARQAGNPLNPAVAGILDDCERWRAHQPQGDDLSLLAIEIK